MFEPAYTVTDNVVTPDPDSSMTITKPKEPTDRFFSAIVTTLKKETPLLLDILQRLNLPFDLCLETANENLHCIMTGQKNSSGKCPLKSDYLVQMYRIIQFAAEEMLIPYNSTIPLSSLFPENTEVLKKNNLENTSVGSYATRRLEPLLPPLEQATTPHIKWQMFLDGAARAKQKKKKQGRRTAKMAVSEPAP